MKTRSRRSWLSVAGFAAFVMLPTATALATPPTITSVTVTPANYGAYLTNVSWSLPSEFKSGTIEVAKDPATNSEGRFHAQNLDTFATLTASQTSWSEYVESGTHYVHVSDCPVTSFFCNPLEGEEWSSVHSFRVPNPSGPGTADTTPPQTNIKSGPSGRTDSHRATFKFRSSEAGSTVQCKLDHKPWTGCSSPKTYKNLKHGKHTFKVRAKDQAGNVDPTPAKRVWHITS